ncbi:hypothetical protein G6F31_021906 [Rhizopus arrhizus]|nr:hypothetical protein G6F31_021906 [Rhizopus arrhizus]
MGGAKGDRDALGLEFAVHRFERQVVRVAWREFALEQAAHQFGQVRTRNAHDADAASSGGGGNGGNGGVSGHI